MKCYFVDYENVNTSGLNGVPKLTEEDSVCIFYTEKADRLTFGLHRRLNESPAAISYRKVLAGSKNALDFQLSSYLGYVICENKDLPCEYYIVSNDKGFDCLVSYWSNKVKIKRITDITYGNISTEDEIVNTVDKLLDNRKEAVQVAKMVAKYKTKQGINNALMRTFPSENNKKASQIYSALKPYIADKKGR